MTKRFCKTYIKTIPKYIQVPPILNFLYGSFSTAWVIYLTARIISTFISISTFPKKLTSHVSSIISIHVISTNGLLSSWLDKFIGQTIASYKSHRSGFDSRSSLNFFRYLFNHLGNFHLTARIISIFTTVSLCNVSLGFTLPQVHLNIRTVPCFACFLSFLLVQFVQLMNDPLRQ